MPRNKLTIKYSRIAAGLLFLVSTLISSTYITAQDTGEEAPELVSWIPAEPEAIAAGEALFKGNCTQCHAIHKVVIGPALANVYDRRSQEWIYSFIRNSQKMIAEGDKQAVALYKEYKNTVMPNHTFLEDADLDNLLAYVQDETIKGDKKDDDDDDDDDDDNKEKQAGVDSSYLTIILVVLIVVLVLILVVLGVIITVLTKYLKQKDDLDEADQELVGQRTDFGKLFNSQGFIGFAAFIFAAIVFKTIIDGLFTVGVQQGYAPRQPIAFSHKLHAGQHEIDCNYCHTGVYISKSANIPSPNICMNCHTRIKTESPEIKKIYAALDFDDATQTYGENQKPIEWVRVHNLPDLVYFNHAQHVSVGGVECQTCHGPIEEMEVVQQYSKLTMGWCIDCHRKTELNTQGNAYYDDLVELHKSKNGKDPLTVAANGGLECAKCHY